MRITTVIRKLLGVTKLFVSDVSFQLEGVVVRVRPTWRVPRCGICSRKAPGYDRRRARRWRHLGIGGLKIWLEYAPRRVMCRRCGIRTEAVPWAEPGSRFTRQFEELAAYLAQQTDKTHVTELMGISWSTVGAIVERILKKRHSPSRFDNLRRIGVDEFSYRKRHRYLTVVVDHDRRQVIWAGAKHTKETLLGFFDELGPERCKGIEYVTLDMAAWFLEAIKERLPHAQVIFDRFHVQQLATKAVDTVRREQLRDLRGSAKGRDIYGLRFALLKRPWDLSLWEGQKLEDLQKRNHRLYRAYLLKESLAEILEDNQLARARAALKQWLSWASRSKIKPFVQVARTIRFYFDGVLAYVKERLTNGLVEGFNTRLRMIARRAYGFHHVNALIAMLYLCCGGIKLEPPLP